MKMIYLRAAVKRLPKTVDSLSEKIITDCVNMLNSEYYDGVVNLFSDVANTGR